MGAVIAGVLARGGPPSHADRARLHAAAGPGAVTRSSGALALAWSRAEAFQDERLCVLAGQRYAGPGPAGIAAFDEPPADLRGDFALVFWDGRRGYLAHDQMGQHGAFFHDDGTTLRFAGEVVTLLALLPHRPSPDGRAIAHWIAAGGQPEGLTLYEGISRLAPGELLPLDVASRRRPRPWFAFRPGPLREGARADLVASLRSVMQTAVDRRTAAGEVTAIQLSGGLDSSTVAGLAAALPPGRRPERAYSVTFPTRPGVDESHLIDGTCAHLGLAVTKVAVGSGSALSGALPYLERWAVPPVSPNLFFWDPMLRRAAQDGIAVLLDGEGGDELFGLSPYLIADELARGRLRSARELAVRIPGIAGEPPPGFVRRFIRSYGLMGLAPASLHAASRRARPAMRYVPRYFTERTARAFLDVADGAAWKRRDGPRWWRWLVWSVHGGPGPAMMYDHVRHRAAMAGVEPRHPLVDVDVVALVLSLPPELAFDGHLTRPLMREAAAGLIPDAVRLRSAKSNFDGPFHDALSGVDSGAASALLGTGARVGAYVDLAAARADLSEAAPPPPGPERMRWALLLWRLLTAECWLLSQEDRAAPRSVLEAVGLAPADAVVVPPPARAIDASGAAR